MEIKNYFAQDAQGNIMPSANCYLYLPGTTTLATGLVDGNGTPISNPFLASGMGQITFGAPNGVYDLRVALGARDWTIKVQCADIVQAMDVMDSILGSHAENPATRNNGQPLELGDETWNSTDRQPYWWDGLTWLALNSSSKKLENDLANPEGSSKVGYKNDFQGSVSRTVTTKLNETFSSLDAGLSSGSSDALRAIMLNSSYLQPMMYGSYRRINGTESTAGVSDEANFAGQGLTSGRPIGWVKHHYTDGIMMQMDNVGDGTALVIKNARNPVRRADKPNDYVGGGIFISLFEEDVAAGFSKGLFFISKAAEFVWTGVKGVASLIQNKAEDGLFAFQMRTTNAHRYFLRILNGGSQLLSIENDVTYTRLVIKSGPPQENGFVLTTAAGRLRLDCAGSYIEVAKPLRAPTGNLLLGVFAADAAVETQVPFKLRDYAALANLPSAETFVGCMARCAGRPVYANGGQWRYVSDDSPVV